MAIVVCDLRTDTAERHETTLHSDPESEPESDHYGDGGSDMHLRQSETGNPYSVCPNCNCSLEVSNRVSASTRSESKESYFMPERRDL